MQGLNNRTKKRRRKGVKKGSIQLHIGLSMSHWSPAVRYIFIDSSVGVTFCLVLPDWLCWKKHSFMRKRQRAPLSPVKSI